MPPAVTSPSGVVQVPNPTFDSQSKDTLATKHADLNALLTFPDRFVRTVADDMGLAQLVIDSLEMKDRLAVQRRVRKSKQVSMLKSMPKLEDANEAGGRRSSECTLILTEGDSAKARAPWVDGR